ncbi:hypothetical protein MET9862_05724 [Methylobacterium symbioticum]|uniref:Uncharacterized protein n=1 Tax=Methylobacterium symbioticum TaxID=2584084 RepID=A0A509EN31_9HYPH|nr:hypothetical protein MET9862_05724 [Methylobacterium symbioticum]
MRRGIRTRRPLRGGAVEPAAQGGDTARHDAFGIRRQLLAGLERVDPVADEVEAVEKPVDNLRFEGEGAGAHLDEEVLRRVDQGGEGRHVEQAGRALQGVHRPEDVVQRIGVVRLLELQHAAAGDLEELARLGNELGEQGVLHDAAPAITRAASASVCGWTGLTR